MMASSSSSGVVLGTVGQCRVLGPARTVRVFRHAIVDITGSSRISRRSGDHHQRLVGPRHRSASVVIQIALIVFA